jgi:hypothetical protein
LIIVVYQINAVSPPPPPSIVKRFTKTVTTDQVVCMVEHKTGTALAPFTTYSQMI